MFSRWVKGAYSEWGTVSMEGQGVGEMIQRCDKPGPAHSQSG